MKTSKLFCPDCGSKNVAPVGSRVPSSNPQWHCKDCGHEWPPRKAAELIGHWRITEMPMFSIEMFEPPMLWIQDERDGLLSFCGMHLGVDYELSEREGKPRLEFTFWEPHRQPHCGRGWADVDGNTMRGKIYFHDGDRSAFKAERMSAEAAEVEEDAVTHLLRQGPITVDPDLIKQFRSQQRKEPKKPKPAEQKSKRPRLHWVQKPKGPIPEKVRVALKGRLEKHIEQNWSHTLVKLLLRFHGAFAYIDVQDPTEDLPTHLCRLDYLGELDHWEWAFYKYSDEVYERSRDWEGSFVTTPEKAFDVAATVYLSGG